MGGIVVEAGGVVAFVEVFEHAREDFGVFGWKVDAFAWGCDVWVGRGGGLGVCVEQCAAKKGDALRMDSWAAKRRC